MLEAPSIFLVGLGESGLIFYFNSKGGGWDRKVGADPKETAKQMKALGWKAQASFCKEQIMS